MTEYQKLLEELNAMPEGLREATAADLRHELAERQADPLANLTPAQHQHLQKLIQQGLDSGPATPWNVDEFLQSCHERYRLKHSNGH